MGLIGSPSVHGTTEGVIGPPLPPVSPNNKSPPLELSLSLSSSYYNISTTIYLFERCLPATLMLTIGFIPYQNILNDVTSRFRYIVSKFMNEEAKFHYNCSQMFI